MSKLHSKNAYNIWNIRIKTLLVIIIELFCHQVNGQTASCNFLCNTDFESPGLVGAGSMRFINQQSVPCWSTTATDGMIEIWGSGFSGVPSFSGVNFVELNANQVSTLFQNFTAPLGGNVQISFAHRGRAGVDVMSVSIGPVGGPYVDLGTFNANNTAWVYNTVNYTFPTAGNQDYTIRFNSVSAAGGSTVGNFLDAISINLPSPSLHINTTPPECGLLANGRIEAIATGGTTPYLFSWIPQHISSSNEAQNLPAGNYTVSVSDFYGCTTTQIVELIANQPYVIVENYDTLCQGQSYLSAAGKIINQNGIYIDTINTQGCDSILIQNITFSDPIQTSYHINICQGDSIEFGGTYYSESGSYSHMFQTWNGCDSSVNLELTVLNKTSHQLFKNSCDSFLWNGQNYTQSGSYLYQTTNDNGCDSLITLDLTISPSIQTQQVIFVCKSSEERKTKISLISNNGCDSIHTMNYILFPDSMLPKASFSTSPDKTVLLPPGLIQTINLSNNANSYIWDFGDGSSHYFSPNPSHTYYNRGQFKITLVANNDNNCSDTGSISIMVEEDVLIFIPNAFTPNNIGPTANEGFKAIISGEKAIEMIICNRWGEIIFSTTDKNQAWDGTFNGQPCQQDVYACHLKVTTFNNDVKKFSRTITLIR
jgi:gliding motility-associated-like protein